MLDTKTKQYSLRRMTKMTSSIESPGLESYFQFNGAGAPLRRNPKMEDFDVLKSIKLSGAVVLTSALMASAGLANAEDAHGNVRYVGDGSVILGDGTRYRLPEGSTVPKFKEGQHVTIEFKKGPDNRNEVTHMRVDD